jgi:hypothetical protein
MSGCCWGATPTGPEGPLLELHPFPCAASPTPVRKGGAQPYHERGAWYDLPSWLVQLRSGPQAAAAVLHQVTERRRSPGLGQPLGVAGAGCMCRAASSRVGGGGRRRRGDRGRRAETAGCHLMASACECCSTGANRCSCRGVMAVHAAPCHGPAFLSTLAALQCSAACHAVVLLFLIQLLLGAAEDEGCASPFTALLCTRVV